MILYKVFDIYKSFDVGTHIVEKTQGTQVQFQCSYFPENWNCLYTPSSILPEGTNEGVWEPHGVRYLLCRHSSHQKRGGSPKKSLWPQELLSLAENRDEDIKDPVANPISSMTFTNIILTKCFYTKSEWIKHLQLEFLWLCIEIFYYDKMDFLRRSVFRLHFMYARLHPIKRIVIVRSIVMFPNNTSRHCFQ